MRILRALVLVFSICFLASPSYSAGFLDELKDKISSSVKGITGMIGSGASSQSAAPSSNNTPTVASPSGGSGSGAVVASGGIPSQVKEASRIFAGPKEFPPSEFGAYAIVAFRSAAGSYDLDRFHMFCEAYRLAIPDASELDIPLSQQLVTVWPLSSEEASKKVKDAEKSKKCDVAAQNYGNVLGLRAIRDARIISRDLAADFANRQGPFLLAWSPAKTKGSADALVLRMDLSDVDTAVVAKSRFEFWVQHIESKPELWLDGWQSVSILKRVGETADKYGQIILDFLKG